jgi:hypothetical protein
MKAMKEREGALIYFGFTALEFEKERTFPFTRFMVKICDHPQRKRTSPWSSTTSKVDS